MCTITHPELPTSTPKLPTKISASRASPVAQWLQNPPASRGDMGWTPGLEDSTFGGTTESVHPND